MKHIYGIYKFSSASQWTKTRNGFDYELKESCRLFKLHTPLFEHLKGHSWYLVLEDVIVIDCAGYIEERCLDKIVTT